MVDSKKIKVTLFKDVTNYSCKPEIITLYDAFTRIYKGESKDICDKLRLATELGAPKDELADIKKKLPGIIFSGEFSARGDANLINHSGLVILDFDKVDVKQKKEELKQKDFILACWKSPSANGVKALVRIADGKKHRQHLKSIFKLFPEIDKQNINEERICFESYDPDLWVNKDAKVYSEFIEEKKPESKNIKTDDEIIEPLLTWLSNRGDAFIEGERNHFIFKLASACCRLGVNEDTSLTFCVNNYSTNEFNEKEINTTVKSAYRKNDFCSSKFENKKLVDKKGGKETVINADIDLIPQSVIYGANVKLDALNLFKNGYESVQSTGIIELDEYFKFKKGEVTVLTGYGNYGKSQYMKFLMMVQVLVYGKKICIFSPEEYPAHEFYHDFVEMYVGDNCLPSNPYRIKEERYLEIYDLISKSIFFIYPQEGNSSPEHIKQIFLEMIIKEKVDYCVIDPFNQLDNDYNSSGSTAKYLERVLGDLGRFTTQNQTHLFIIAHPKAPKEKDKSTGNYPCPDVFDINDGAMWNNKVDNILVFHKPYMQTDTESPACEHHSKKIRRQKIVGKKGNFSFEFDRKKRRFIYDGKDYIDLFFNPKPQELPLSSNFTEPKEKDEYIPF